MRSVTTDDFRVRSVGVFANVDGGTLNQGNRFILALISFSVKFLTSSMSLGLHALM